jgi:xanthine dehydrogenase accessory factor
MEKIFLAIEEQLKMGKPCLLATIIASTGSTPRSSGAYMVVGEAGRICGTIGGGSLEYNVILQGQEQIVQQKNFIYEYTLTMEGSAELGMICGGTCTILCQYLAADDLPLIQEAMRIMESKEQYWLLLPVLEGKLQIWQGVSEIQGNGLIEIDGTQYYAERFNFDGKVYIFGGGHLAQEVVPVLSHLGFRCVVLDDREEFSKPELFTGAEEVLCVDFKDLANAVQITENDYVAVMTRGHLHDADVERFVLKTPAHYIGVVGSRRKAKLTRETLRGEGFTEEQLDRIITPIGLEIGSETPAEIAISIAAQFIQVRANRLVNMR